MCRSSQKEIKCIKTLSETWLTDYVLNTEIQIPDYTLYRGDRKGRVRGDAFLQMLMYLGAR